MVTQGQTRRETWAESACHFQSILHVRGGQGGGGRTCSSKTFCQSFREKAHVRVPWASHQQAGLSGQNSNQNGTVCTHPAPPNVWAIQKKELVWLPAPKGLIQRPVTSRGFFAFSLSPFPFLHILSGGQQCRDQSPTRKLGFRTVPVLLPS